MKFTVGCDWEAESQCDRRLRGVWFTPNNNSSVTELITTLFSRTWPALLTIIHSGWHVPSPEEGWLILAVAMATTKYCLDDDEKRLYTRSLTMCTRRDERILIKKRKITSFFLLRRLLAEYFYFKNNPYEHLCRLRECWIWAILTIYIHCIW